MLIKPTNLSTGEVAVQIDLVYTTGTKYNYDLQKRHREKVSSTIYKDYNSQLPLLLQKVLAWLQLLVMHYNIPTCY